MTGLLLLLTGLLWLEKLIRLLAAGGAYRAVVAREADQTVVAGGADRAVGAGGADRTVVTGAADWAVVAREADRTVATGAADLAAIAATDWAVVVREAYRTVATGEADRAVAAGGADQTGAVTDQEAVVLVVVAGEHCRESVATEMAIVSRETGMSRPHIALSLP